MSEGYIINHRGEEVEPKRPRIYALQIEDSGTHFHKINYKKDLKSALQKDLHFGLPGLLTSVMYYEDENKQIPILDVIRSYETEPSTGRLLKKRTQRKYWNEDGTENEDLKDGGWYIYTPEESRAGTHRRRMNITNKIEADMLNLLVQSAGGSAAQIALNLKMGAAFMSALAPSISSFHLSGSIAGIAEYVTDPEVHVNFPFLLADVAPGVKGYQFIIAGVTY